MNQTELENAYRLALEMIERLQALVDEYERYEGVLIEVAQAVKSGHWTKARELVDAMGVEA